VGYNFNNLIFYTQQDASYKVYLTSKLERIRQTTRRRNNHAIAVTESILIFHSRWWEMCILCESNELTRTSVLTSTIVHSNYRREMESSLSIRHAENSSIYADMYLT
jgi:hypothetical protein